MSYSIALWDPSRHQPVPTTFDEATAMYRQLADINDEPNYWFVAFAQRIQDHVRLSPNPDETLLGYYGNFVETAQTHTGALFLIDIPTEERISMLRLMVETATALNLVVYDDASGLAWLPGGKVLPEEKAGLWAEIKAGLDRPSDLPRTKAEFQKMADSVFAELFGRHGFKWGKSPGNESALVRELQGGRQSITIDCGRLEGGYRIGIGIWVSCEAVDEVYRKFNFVQLSSVFGLNFSRLFGGNEGVKVFYLKEFETLCPVIVSRAMEILDATANIFVLDQVLNGGADECVKNEVRGGSFLPTCLIVVRLAGNPDFERLAVELSEAAAKFWGGDGPKHTAKRNEFARLVKYLRDDVKPLV